MVHLLVSTNLGPIFPPAAKMLVALAEIEEKDISTSVSAP